MNFGSCLTSFIIGYILITEHLASVLEGLILFSNGNVMSCYLQYYIFREESKPADTVIIMNQQQGKATIIPCFSVELINGCNFATLARRIP